MSTKLLRHLSSKSRAQAMVEFAIVLPILVMLLIGIFEVGRLVFAYAAVTNASREAARFGSALGYDDDGYHKYKDCNGILQMAKRSSFFLPLTLNTTNRNNPPPNSVTITYDGSTSAWCQQPIGEDPSVFVSSGDRVIITVTYAYAPYTRLVPFPSKTYTAKSARTILGYIALDGSGGSNPGGIGPGGSTSTSTPSGGGGSTSTPTATFPGLPTSTATATATNTETPVSTVVTLTTIPSATITLLPSPTGTATATATNTGTPTNTSTPSNTPTPTNTATAKPGCGNIIGNAIAASTNTMYMTFANPYSDLTVSNVQVKWVANGANAPVLQSATLGSLFWTGSNNSGNATLTPTGTLTIPGNNITSAIIFTFDKNYSLSNSNKESIIIHLSTSGCTSFTIQYPSP